MLETLCRREDMAVMEILSLKSVRYLECISVEHFIDRPSKSTPRRHIQPITEGPARLPVIMIDSDWRELPK